MAMKSGGKPKSAEATVSELLERSTPSPPELELPEWLEDIKLLKEFFQSPLWKYPVHTFIGEIVKGQP